MESEGQDRFPAAVAALDMYAGSGQPVADPLLALAHRVVQSRGFVRSRLLTRFLLHICERQTLGLHDQLTEQQIGEQVFGRPPGYRPGEDNIVRNYARLLRQRLEEYFSTDGLEEPQQIVVPRGRYLPMLVARPGLSFPGPVEVLPSIPPEILSQTEAPPEREAANPFALLEQGEHRRESGSPEVPAVRTTQRRLNPLWWIAVAVVLVTALVSVLWVRHHAQSLPPPTFWAGFFNSGRDALVVPGDDGLVIYQDLTHTQVTLHQYATGDYRNTPSAAASTVANEIGTRRYTSFVDLQIVSRLLQLPEATNGRFKIRFAREVSLDDLKQENVILMGSLHSNPWTELYQQGLNFQFQSQPGAGDLVIRNVAPRSGEQARYSTANDEARTTYGLLALLPNLNGSNQVLLLEGINMAGTQAAADLLLESKLPQAILQSRTANGFLQPFEILVKTSNFGANAPGPEIVALRTGRAPHQQWK